MALLKYLLYFSCLNCYALSFAQISVNAQSLPDEPFFYYQKNPVTFRHSNPDSDTLWLIPDTINVCRIQSNRIRKVDIYEFKSRTDSALFETIYYNEFGLIDSLKPNRGWMMSYDYHIYDTMYVNCDSIFSNYQLNVANFQNRIKYFKGRQRTEYTVKYDSQGYLDEVKYEKTGLIKKGYLFNSITNYKRKYIYDEKYLSVKIYYCHVKRGRVDKYCDFGSSFFYLELDEMKNLKSELYLDEKKPDKFSGFKYFYTYY